MSNAVFSNYSVPIDDVNAPTCRQGHAAALLDRRMYVFSGRVPSKNGGTSRAYVHDFWCFDLDSGRWKKIELLSVGSPAERHSHSLCSYKSKIYLFGGSNNTEYLADLWVFDVESEVWSRIEGNAYAPSARHGHSATVCENLMIVFGGKHGYGASNVYYNDVHAFNLDNEKWIEFKTQNNSQIPTRCWHTCSFIKRLNVIVMFAGFMIDEHKTELYYKDLWALYLDEMEWRRVEFESGCVPHERNRHVMLNLDDERILVHSGNYFVPTLGDQWLDDVYLLKANFNSKFEWEKLRVENKGVVNPIARGHHTAVYNNKSDEVLLFGGEYHRQRFNDIISIKIEGHLSQVETDHTTGHVSQ